MTEPSFLNCTIEDSVAFISIDRPPVNVLGFSHFETVCHTVLNVVERADVKAVIITGNDNAFVSGFDIKEIASIEKSAQARGDTMRIKGLLAQLEAARKPIVAAIRGNCLGGGLELAMTCHIRLSTAQAKLGLPEINLATIPTFGGTVRLARIVGRARALELILTGKLISGEEAFQMGLINEVCRDGELLQRARLLCRTIAEKGPLAVAAAIQAITAATEVDTEQAMELESELSARLIETKDLKEGIAAFFERRKAVYTNS